MPVFNVSSSKERQEGRKERGKKGERREKQRRGGEETEGKGKGIRIL